MIMLYKKTRIKNMYIKFKKKKNMAPWCRNQIY